MILLEDETNKPLLETSEHLFLHRVSAPSKSGKW
jgi:hypothetical protein